MKKKTTLLLVMIATMILLAGCSEINQPITDESTGFWNQYIVYPLSWLITKAAELFSTPNYGIAIILVTILIRLVILPLMLYQIKSTQAMQQLQPEIKKLQAKYSSKDKQTQQQLQQEQMMLYQKYKVNPFAGCLPIFIQMPILIGFYHAIMRTGEIKQHTFLWLQLGEKDPYFILPVAAAIMTFIQQRVMLAGYDKETTAPQMMTQLKMMQYLMPPMILFSGSMLPSALSLYWVIGNIFSIGQTYLMNYMKKRHTIVIEEVEETETAADNEITYKKPAKKKQRYKSGGKK